MFKNCRIAGKGINSEAYHKQEAPRGDIKHAMSPSSLKLFAECPSRYIAGYEPPSSEAKDWGNLLDVLFLTPESFQGRFSVKPATYPAEPAKKGAEAIQKPFNANSTWCKAWIEEQGNKTVISQSEQAEAQQAVKTLLADETIAEYRACSDVQVHVVGEWHDKGTKLVIPVQCLIDLVPKPDSVFQKSLGDLKSTRNASLNTFGRWCYTAGYHIQAAFDLALYTAATGEDRTDWNFVLQENYPPFQTGRRLLGQDLLQIGEQTYRHALERYTRCLESGQWDSYDPPEEWSIVNAEPWMEFNALESNMEHLQTTPEPAGEIIP